MKRTQRRRCQRPTRRARDQHCALAGIDHADQLRFEPRSGRALLQLRHEVACCDGRLQVGQVGTLGQPVRAGRTAGITDHVDPLQTGHPAAFIGRYQAAGRARQRRLVEPALAGQSRHVDNQFDSEFALVGDHPIGIKSNRSDTQPGLDATLVHFGQDPLRRARTKNAAGLGR